MKSEPEWPSKTNREDDPDHASWGNFDDSYSLGYDIGYDVAITACITAFNDWLKEQKPIVLPDRKRPQFNSSTEEHERIGWNSCLDELMRLNPQIRNQDEK